MIRAALPHSSEAEGKAEHTDEAKGGAGSTHSDSISVHEGEDIASKTGQVVYTKEGARAQHRLHLRRNRPQRVAAGTQVRKAVVQEAAARQPAELRP